MVEECHRCGAELEGDGSSFCCSHCGSPQLHMLPVIRGEDEGRETTGAAPPPRAPAIRWRTALRSGLLVAAVGVGLFLAASWVPILTIASVLWTVSAASIAISLYLRWEPSLKMDGSIGARIGLSVGVVMTFALGISLTVIGLIARFGMRSMAAFDAEMSRRMQEQVAKAIAAYPAPAEVVRQMLSDEFRTGVMLAGLLIFAVLILASSTVGGMVSGMVAVGRRRAA